MMNEAYSLYRKKGYEELAIGVAKWGLAESKSCIKLIWFFIRIIQMVSLLKFPVLTLELLELSEEEAAMTANPIEFFIHYLRQNVLYGLAKCDDIFTALIASSSSKVALKGRWNVAAFGAAAGVHCDLRGVGFLPKELLFHGQSLLFSLLF